VLETMPRTNSIVSIIWWITISPTPPDKGGKEGKTGGEVEWLDRGVRQGWEGGREGGRKEEREEGREEGRSPWSSWPPCPCP
jgi:hypothetical protein